MAAAALVVGLFAAPGIAHKEDTESSSFAEISLVDCMVESSKDISYVAFLDSGEELDKFNVNAPTYDLTSYDSIDDVDSVRVKSGQTVESFGVSDCADDTTGTDGDPADDSDGTTGDDSDDTTDDDADDTTGDQDGDVTEPDNVESHNDRANANSQATITMSGCVVDSSKDISYVAFFTDGEQVDKIEDIDTTSYDLTSHEGIDEVDSIRVKAGTTIATFSVSCGTAGTEDDTTTGDEATSDEDEDSTTDDDATEDDDTTTDDDATEDDDVADDDVKEDEDVDDDADEDVEDDADDDIDDDEDQDYQEDDDEDDEEA